MTQFIETLVGIFQSSGFAKFGEPGGWLYAVMICVGCFLLYLAIVKEFEPLILLPMAFGMILANLPGSGVIHMQYFVGDGLEHPMWVEILNNGVSCVASPSTMPAPTRAPQVPRFLKMKLENKK